MNTELKEYVVIIFPKDWDPIHRPKTDCEVLEEDELWDWLDKALTDKTKFVLYYLGACLLDKS